MNKNILAAKPDFDFQHRSSGILLHLTSLPSPHGRGDLGPEAYRFIDFLADAGQTWWQMLPVGPHGRAPGFSPYDSASAFAGDPWLLSLTELGQQGLLTPDDLKPVKVISSRKVNYPTMQIFPKRGCGKLIQSFIARGENRIAFREFCDANF